MTQRRASWVGSTVTEAHAHAGEKERAGPASAGLRTYVAFVKPHIGATFVLVALSGSALAVARAGVAPFWRFAGAAIAVALLSAGAECWTNLLDRDVDAIMERTKWRALPSGAISARGAATLGALLTGTGLAAAAALGPLPLVFLGSALLDNVVIYSALTKRVTLWSIVLGAAVGPLTLWAGYVAVDIHLSGPALLLGAMVAAWVPVHIWAIATLYRGDYVRARIPMAPAVWGHGPLALASGTSAVLMGAAATAGLVLIGGPGSVWVAGVVGVLSLLVAGTAVLLPWRPALAPRLIRLVTLYLVVVLLAAIGLGV